MMGAVEDCRWDRGRVCRSAKTKKRMREGYSEYEDWRMLTVGVETRAGRDRVPEAFRFEGFVSERSSSSSSSDSDMRTAVEFEPLS
jgi:hypothetical protein